MSPRGAALAELGIFYGLVLAVIWLGQVLSVRPPSALAALLVLGFCLWSNRRHKDGLERIGLSPAWFKPCLRLTLKTLSVPLAALTLWAALPPLPSLERILYGARGLPASLRDLPVPALLFLGLLRYPLWAFAQEYALLSFLANRWRDVLGARPWAVSLVNGLLFSLVHAPNPILMTACLVGGIAFTRVFLKTPHLVPLAVVHALAGLALSLIFRDFPPAMMVGPAYLRAVFQAVSF